MILRLAASLFIIFRSALLVAQSVLVPADTLIDNYKCFGFKKNNRFLIAPVYSEAQPFEGDLALVKERGYYFYVNKKGIARKNSRFVNARSFSEGMAATCFSTGWGFINTRMEPVIAPQYNNALSFSESLAGVKKDKWFFITRKNTREFEAEYDSVVSGFQNGVALVGIKKERWLYGAISKSGSWVVPCQYLHLKRLGTGLLLGEVDEHYYTVLNLQGKVLLQHLEEVNAVNDTLFLFQHQARYNLFNAKGIVQYKQGLKSWSETAPISFPSWRLLDSAMLTVAQTEADSFVCKGNQIVACLNQQYHPLKFPVEQSYFSQIELLDKGHMKVKRMGKWAVSDTSGKQLLPFKFDSLSVSGPYWVFGQQAKYGLLSPAGTQVLFAGYDALTYSSLSGRMFVQSQTGSGFLTKEGRQLFETKEYTSLTELSKLHLLGRSGPVACVLDTAFRKVFATPVQHAKTVSDSLVIAFSADSMFAINPINGKTCSRRIQLLTLLNDSLAWVRAGLTKGVYHFRTDTLVMTEADTVWRHTFVPDRLLTRLGPDMGYAAAGGKLLTSYNRTFRYIGPVENGFLRVISKKRHGFIDTSGHLLIATQYDSVGSVSEGFASVKIGKNWGFVNLKEALIVQPNYQKAGFFYYGKAAVWFNGLATLADATGTELFKPRFHSLTPGLNGTWLSRKGHNYGFIGADGKELLTPRFTNVTAALNKYYIVTQYEKTGIIDLNCTIRLPFQYKQVKWIKGSYLFAIQAE